MEKKYKITEMSDAKNPEFSFINVYCDDSFLTAFIFRTDDLVEKNAQIKRALKYANEHKENLLTIEKTLYTL